MVPLSLLALQPVATSRGGWLSIGYLVELTDENAIQPFVVPFTGPHPCCNSERQFIRKVSR